MILIINCGSSKTPLIAERLSSLNFENKTVLMNNFESNHDLHQVKGIIISGAPILITEIETSAHIEKFKFLKTITIPVLGICFGHQILGLVYGAIPLKCVPDRNWQAITIENKSEIFSNFDLPLKMMEDHCEQISIPSTFLHLASSKTCNNEAMQHRNKKLFGVQFHPEVSENNGILLLKNFCNLC